jgi:hypothetical protein
MTYSTIAQCANDFAFQSRVTACIAQEGIDPPGVNMAAYMWQISTAKDIEDAYAYALNVNNDNPGGDDTVITDGMILSYVQANPPTA